MAIASVGTLGTGAASGAGSTVAFSPNAQLDAGNVGLLVLASDNAGTTEAVSSEHSTVTDTAGNTWTKLGEYRNGNGAAQDGVTVSVWYTRAASNLPTTGTITCTITTSGYDRCATAWEFTAGANLRLATAASNNAVDANAGFGSVTVSGLPSKSYLWFRGLGKEANSTTNITPSTSFTALTAQRSRNNANAVFVRGEFRVVTATSQTSNPTQGVTGDAAGVFVVLEEGYAAAAAVSAGAAAASGSATFVGGSYLASAAVSVGHATASGSAGFAYHPVGRLTRARAGLAGRNYVTFAGKQVTPPFSIGVGAVTVGAAACSGQAAHGVPHPVGRLTRARHGIAGRVYGSFASKGSVYAAAAALTAGHAAASGAAVFDPPTYTAGAAVTAGHASAAGAATFAAGAKTATAALTAGHATAAGAASFGQTVTASAALTAGHATAAGSAVFVPRRTASAAVSVGHASASGGAGGVRLAAAAVGTAAAFAAGLATSAAPVYVGAGAVSARAASASGTASSARPAPGTGGGAVLRSRIISGRGRRSLVISGG